MSDILELTIERPVAGGRMLARHGGRIVFVAGAIPGERVRARVDRISRQSYFATTTDVIDASPDRRIPRHDPACGGSLFAHIAYDRQRQLKQEILIDAFRRIGHIELSSPPDVAASPEHGYRVRARLHTGKGQLGFYLEGSHTICDAAATGQLMPEALEAASAVFQALGSHAAGCAGVVISENVSGSERVIHLEPHEHARLDNLQEAVATAKMTGLTGITTTGGGRLHTLAGRSSVTDTSASLLGGEEAGLPPVTWSRRAPTFFQGNRFLTGSLVRRVLLHASGERVVDLYAGAGLFSVALAARGADVVAVEAEPFAAADLAENARPWLSRLHPLAATVEDAVRDASATRPDAVVLDPPRTGCSAEALEGVAEWSAPTVIYVSCDAPTLARDAARLSARGYRLRSIEAFDLFPNTPHVEALAVFTR